MQEKNTASVEIDLAKLLHLLWSKFYWILLAAILLGIAGYSYARFCIAPAYRAETWFYVNNNAISMNDSDYSISTGQISGARSLVDTYAVILSSRSTLDQVAEVSNLPYSAGQLKRMVSCSAVNDTEMFSVITTANDPDEAFLIAKTVAEVLPVRIADIVEHSSVRVVDEPQRPSGRSGPNYSRYVLIGVLLGAIIAAVAIFLKDYFDDVIRSDAYLSSTYSFPILSRIPNLDAGTEKETYYAKGGSHADYYKEGE